jgi:putative ribosome biogenesis GTPase RsgA
MRIKMSDKTNFILINIDKRTNEAILRFKERKNKKSKVHFINYIDRFITKLYAMPPKEQHVLNFLIFCQARVPELIFSMISDYGTRSCAPAMEILGQDHNFYTSIKKDKISI